MLSKITVAGGMTYSSTAGGVIYTSTFTIDNIICGLYIIIDLRGHGENLGIDTIIKSLSLSKPKLS